MKRTVLFLACAAFVMLALPWLAVTLIKGPDAMAVCFALFFAVDPLFSVLLGIFAGRAVKTRWFLPLANVLLFLFGTWLFFDMGETAFLLYAAIYLFLGSAAMGITAYVKRRSAS